MKHIHIPSSIGNLFLSLAFLAIFGLFGCEKVTLEGPTIDPNEPISFTEDIIPIFENNCISCHGGAVAPDLTAGEAFTELTEEGYVNTSSPAESEIVVKLKEGHLAGFSDVSIQKIEAWIAQGAQNN